MAWSGLRRGFTSSNTLPVPFWTSSSVSFLLSEYEMRSLGGSGYTHQTCLNSGTVQRSCRGPPARLALVVPDIVVR